VIASTVGGIAGNGSSDFTPKALVAGRLGSLDSLSAQFQNRPVKNRPTIANARSGWKGRPPPFRGCRAKENHVKKEEVLAKVASGDLTIEEASKMLADEAPKRGTLYCKVSAKGAVSVYGLQRMPVTLYVEQWERLLGFGDDIKTFLKDHDAELKRKERTP
jgi:hypothetical protein